MCLDARYIRCRYCINDIYAVRYWSCVSTHCVLIEYYVVPLRTIDIYKRINVVNYLNSIHWPCLQIESYRYINGHRDNRTHSWYQYICSQTAHTIEYYCILCKHTAYTLYIIQVDRTGKWYSNLSYCLIKTSKQCRFNLLDIEMCVCVCALLQVDLIECSNERTCANKGEQFE